MSESPAVEPEGDEQAGEQHVAGMFTAEEDAAFEAIKTDLGYFVDYERGFQEVLMSLEHDDVLDRFMQEYAALHFSFLTSHEGEHRLLRKCTDLQSEIYTCAAKAHAAEALSADDAQTIERLKTGIKKSHQRMAAVTEKEEQLKGQIDVLKEEVAELEQRAGEPIEASAQEAALQTLRRVREAMLHEVEMNELQLSNARHAAAAAASRVQKLGDHKRSEDAELRVVLDAIEAKQTEMEAVSSDKDRAEEELRAVRTDITRRTALCVERQATLDQLRREHAQHGENLQGTTAEAAALAEACSRVGHQLQTTNAALQDCNEENDNWQHRVAETVVELHALQAAAASTHRQYVKDTKVLEALGRRNAVAAQRRLEHERQVEAARVGIRHAEAELVAAREAVERVSRQLASVKREADLLHQEHLTQEREAQRNASWTTEKETQLRNLSQELAEQEQHVQHQSDELHRATRDCCAYEEQLKESIFKCAALAGEVQARERRVEASRQAAHEVELRLTQQQGLLDAVTSERNALAKHALQLREDLREMTAALQLLLRQVGEAKMARARRARGIHSIEDELASLERQRLAGGQHIEQYHRRVLAKGKLIEQLTAELRTLDSVVADGHEAVARQRRRCYEVVGERDRLNGQVNLRDDELASLYEQLRTQQALLSRGAAVYSERSEHAEQLQYQCARLSDQLAQLRQFNAQLPNLRLLINNKRRELTGEQVKVRALLSECEQPLNLHAHRELAWSEPETYALVERVQSLQRTLVERREALADAERSILAEEERYLAAKGAAARQPGPEVAEQLSSYQTNLVKQRGQVAQLREGLRHFREQTELYRGRHEELRGQLSDMAKEYAAQRERDEAASRLRHSQEAAAANTEHLEYPEDSGAPAYTGFVAPPLEQTSVPTGM